MIEAIEKNLERGIKLLNSISNDEYVNNSIPPYFSSIGCHIRHILDVFTCVLEGQESRNIDLTKRERNEIIEQNIDMGISYFETTISRINRVSTNDLSIKVKVTDDLGSGKLSADYTLGSALMQAQSHAIHHYASIGYIIFQLGIDLPDADFGYNPSTLKKELN